MWHDAKLLLVIQDNNCHAADGGAHSSNALKVGLAVGIPCAAAAAAAGVLFWWCCLRRRKTSALSTTASAKGHRELAAKEGNLLSTEDIVFEKDERGKRLLLGEGAFAKVSSSRRCPWKLWELRTLSCSLTQGDAHPVAKGGAAL